MKIDDFLRQYPWEESFELLCRAPPASRDLPLGVAVQLIQQLRESQIPSLIPLMVSPLIDTGSADEPDSTDVTQRDPWWGMQRLREPRRTARLFVEHTVRAGKDLRPYEIADLQGIGGDDAALGRLLRVLSIAGDASVQRRAKLRGEWRDIMAGDADFGAVLGPMVLRPRVAQRSHAAERLAGELALRLSAESSLQGNAVSTTGLMQWVAALAREGRQRIAELRAQGP